MVYPVVGGACRADGVAAAADAADAADAAAAAVAAADAADAADAAGHAAVRSPCGSSRRLDTFPWPKYYFLPDEAQRRFSSLVVV